jgi:uncharacterized protein (DUF2267 family)
MDGQDVLARIQERGRLYGINQTRRAVHGVLGVLADLLPTPAFRRLTAHLPADVRPPVPSGEGRPIEVLTCRAFITRLATRLHLEEPDAAFLARVVFEQLNTAAEGASPATVAHLVAADLRPLLSAGVPQTRPAAPQFRIRLTVPARPAVKQAAASAR